MCGVGAVGAGGKARMADPVCRRAEGRATARAAWVQARVWAGNRVDGDAPVHLVVVVVDAR